MMSNHDYDFEVSTGGTINYITPRSPEAHVWLDDHVINDETMTLGPSVVEGRYLDNLLVGVLRDGFTVQINGEPLELIDHPCGAKHGARRLA
jgi:hypothetical protein